MNKEVFMYIKYNCTSKQTYIHSIDLQTITYENMFVCELILHNM